MLKKMAATAVSTFPEEVLEHVLSFLAMDKDRNAVSLVCKSWFEVERWSRHRVFVGNCYAVSPATLIKRFPEVRSVELKGKPHFADFNLVPEGWGGHFFPWARAFACAYPWLEEIRLKRMVVSDDALDIISTTFRNFKVLILSSCEGFSSDGLASIAANCRNLKVLDLCESDIEDTNGHWLSCFPDSYTSLVSLNISCFGGEVNLPALERLVSRSPNLTALRLNQGVPLERLSTLICKAPQLNELGTGRFCADIRSDVYSSLSSSFSSLKNLKSLSGFWDVTPAYLPALFPVFAGITSLNLSYANIQCDELIKVVCQCNNLQRLWVIDHIEDMGLQAVASSCKDLQELRVFPSNPYGEEVYRGVTEQGLVSISSGCLKLQSVLYFCQQMTNEALITIARNSPNLTRFRLCIMEPRVPDYKTLNPLDVGFGAIVQNCKGLKRLSLSGLLTDRVFEFIGKHGKKLEMLSVAFAGDSDMGLHHVLSGCENLRKLEIRDCPFGDKALIENCAKLETMRSLWMSSCFVSYGACKALGNKLRRLCVEVIDERESPENRPDYHPVDKLYIYRSVAGPRFDAPNCVWIMD